MGFGFKWIGVALVKRGWRHRTALLAEYYVDLVFQQVTAIVPITIMLVVTMGIYFGRAVSAPGELAGGTLAAIIGLSLFMDSLRVSVMPLGERLGRDLPKHVPLPGVLAVTGCLGVLVTYAEPAISSLRPLAKLVDPEVAPFLYIALNQQQEVLILAIALGVALAAMVGTLRFVKKWNLRPIILSVIVPTLACAGYMWWGDENLKPLLGLAWDSGAVTTGPVTVPVLLALGIGVMRTQKEKDKQREREEAGEAVEEPPANHQPARERMSSRMGQLMGLEDDTQEDAFVDMRPVEEKMEDFVRGVGGDGAGGEGDEMEGFGIVTLASLFPVLAVELMAIGLSLTYTEEEVLKLAIEWKAAEESSVAPIEETTPLREVVFAVRSILPLNVALVLLCIFVLKKRPPRVTFFLTAEDPDGDDETNRNTVLNRTASADGPQPHTPTGGGGGGEPSSPWEPAPTGAAAQVELAGGGGERSGAG